MITLDFNFGSDATFSPNSLSTGVNRLQCPHLVRNLLQKGKTQTKARKIQPECSFFH